MQNVSIIINSTTEEKTPVPHFLLLIRFDYNENPNRMSFSSILNNETLSPCHIHGSRYNYINTINMLVLKYKELMNLE